MQNFLMNNFRILHPGGKTEHVVEMLGVKGDASPTTTKFMGAAGYTITTGGMFYNCGLDAVFYCKNAGYPVLKYTNTGSFEFRNCAYPSVEFGGSVKTVSCIVDFDSLHADGAHDDGNYGLYSRSFDTYQDFQLLNDGFIGFDGYPWSINVGRHFNMDDSSQCWLKNSYVQGNWLAEPDCQGRLLNCHVQGDVTLDNGTGACIMDGGSYIGTLSDPGGRLTRTVGS
jgi:hypothetical protein